MARWKLVMKKSITALGLWRTLANSGLQEAEAITLAGAIFDVMRGPVPPAPALRREARAFNTPLQDFWAYGYLDSYQAPTDPNFDLFLDFLEAFQYELRGEIERPVDWELLAVARWHALKGEPYSRSSTAASSLTTSDLSGESPTIPDLCTPHFVSRRLRMSQPTLLRIYYSLKKAISFRCQLTLRLLQDCKNSLQLLSTYVNLWNSYSAAALRLHEIFKGFFDVLQGIYEEKWTGGEQGPEASIVRMMVLAWRRKVFTPLESLLNEQTFNLLQIHRAFTLHQLQNPSPRSGRKVLLEDPEGILLQRYSLHSTFQAFLDLSVHEKSVLFLDHSQVVPEQPFLTLHLGIVESGKVMLSELMGDPVVFQRGVQADLKFVKRLVPVATYRELESVYATQEAVLWQRHFLTLQSSSWVRVPPSLHDSDPILNSAFGLMLFSACPNRALVQAFIEYLLAVDQRNRKHMERYVELVEEIPGKYELEDEKVDFEAGRARCHRDMLGGWNLFSLWRDVRLEDLQLLSLREDMQICD